MVGTGLQRQLPQPGNVAEAMFVGVARKGSDAGRVNELGHRLAPAAGLP